MIPRVNVGPKSAGADQLNRKFNQVVHFNEPESAGFSKPASFA